MKIRATGTKLLKAVAENEVAFCKSFKRNRLVIMLFIFARREREKCLLSDV
jgi:hypothetical protein